MKRKLILLSLFLISGLVTLACLNEHHVNKSGRTSIAEFSLGDLNFYKRHNTSRIEEELAYLQKAKMETPQDSLWNQNSFAVNYIKLGRLAEAEKILNSLLKKYPNDYSVIVNLGTLYELQGKNQKALEFIKKAIALNSDSHNGSEWVHVKVLEFKLRKIPANRIPGEDILGIKSRKEIGDNIAWHVRFQLEERIPFTPSPDLGMAKILQEYGDYLADSVSIKAAYVMYEIGMDYDSVNLLKLDERRNALLPYFKKYKEAVPITKNYYVDNIISTVTKVVGDDPLSVLEKGLNYFNEQEKERRRKQQQKRQTFLIAGGVALASLGLFIYYRRRKGTA